MERKRVKRRVIHAAEIRNLNALLSNEESDEIHHLAAKSISRGLGIIEAFAMSKCASRGKSWSSVNERGRGVKEESGEATISTFFGTSNPRSNEPFLLLAGREQSSIQRR